MGSICYRNFFSRKVIFKCCGGCIKPKYEYIGNHKIVSYNDKYKNNIDLFKDNDFLNFLKDNKEINYIGCVIKTDNREKDLQYIESCKQSAFSIKEFDKYFILYRCYTYKDIIGLIGKGQYALRANCMYY